MSSTPNFGTPGENWNEERTEWRGKPANLVWRVKDDYEELARVDAAREETEAVLAQYGEATGATPEELDRTTAIMRRAYELVLEELHDGNLLEDVARIIDASPEQLKGYHVSFYNCNESPYGHCLYAQQPEFDVPCVFCGLMFR